MLGAPFRAVLSAALAHPAWQARRAALLLLRDLLRALAARGAEGAALAQRAQTEARRAVALLQQAQAAGAGAGKAKGGAGGKGGGGGGGGAAASAAASAAGKALRAAVLREGAQAHARRAAASLQTMMSGASAPAGAGASAGGGGAEERSDRVAVTLSDGSVVMGRRGVLGDVDGEASVLTGVVQVGARAAERARARAGGRVGERAREFDQPAARRAPLTISFPSAPA
jgi:hypothetical protein